MLSYDQQSYIAGVGGVGTASAEYVAVGEGVGGHRGGVRYFKTAPDVGVIGGLVSGASGERLEDQRARSSGKVRATSNTSPLRRCNSNSIASGGRCRAAASPNASVATRSPAVRFCDGRLV